MAYDCSRGVPNLCSKSCFSTQQLIFKNGSYKLKTTYFLLAFNPFVDGDHRGSSTVLQGQKGILDKSNGGHDIKRLGEMAPKLTFEEQTKPN